MHPAISPGKRLRQALLQERPLQVAGVINAYCALLAAHAGFRALYLSGAGVANASRGLPDLGMTTLNDVVEEVRRITLVSDLPLLVDADTGFGQRLMIERTVQELIATGAAGMHIEDQAAAKRCGHRPGKQLVSAPDMVARIEAAVAARSDPDFVIMARTDALASEGLDGVLQRLQAYSAAGADMVFAEAFTSLEQYRSVTAALSVPLLANLTEFGRTPLFHVDELRAAGVALALYPLSAFRAMSAAAQQVYTAIRQQGSQQAVVECMQSRDELYAHLDYLAFERRLSGKQAGGEQGDE
ncbi:MAG: methylisocitrate lyase [Gammaproteobacteria bacterium]